MATTWSDVISLSDGGTPVKYQVESSAPDPGTGAGNRHRLLENGIEYTPAPQGTPCRSPNYIATAGNACDPGGSLHYGGVTGARLYRIVDITP